jgi:hypothetical protein
LERTVEPEQVFVTEKPLALMQASMYCKVGLELDAKSSADGRSSSIASVLQLAKSWPISCEQPAKAMSVRQAVNVLIAACDDWASTLPCRASLAAWRGLSQKVSGFVMRASVLLGAA